jgi:pimeloyl-ACP methyl ester carboxylesterase
MTIASNEVTLPQGTIRYRDSGEGEPIVFVHGLLVNGTLWDGVSGPLAANNRCIVPDWPLGSHRTPMPADADVSPPAVAMLIADFIEALDLERVTLVANDTGGAISQLLVTSRPERIGRLVLTNCDAYENFLPPFFRPLQWLARVPGALTVALQPMRVRAVAASPLGFGLLTKRPVPDETLDSWIRPALEDPGVRRDTRKLLRGIDKRLTLDAAEKLRDFPAPTLLAWAPEDRFFKFSFAEKLAGAFPDARLERIEDSRTFVSMDQPERLAELISAFVAETKPVAAG